MTSLTRLSPTDIPGTTLQKLQGLLPPVPLSNFLRMLANSPASLEGYLELRRSLGNGSLTAATAQRIALAISEFNNSNYSLSLDIHVARKCTHLSDAEITANRNGSSNCPTAEAAVRFAVAVARQRGRVSQAELDALLAAGYGPPQAVEIVFHVGMAILSNYFNEVAGTELDFPEVRCRNSAASFGRL